MKQRKNSVSAYTNEDAYMNSHSEERTEGRNGDTFDARVKRVLREAAKTRPAADKGEQPRVLMEVSDIMRALVAKFTEATEVNKMAAVDAELELSGFQGPDFCEQCAAFVSNLDKLALSALMQGTATELLNAHMNCRGREDRWDADFSGEVHECMLNTSAMRSLARRQAINIATTHGKTIRRIQKVNPIGRLYGPRGSDRLWIGSTLGWKLGTDVTSDFDKCGRDKVDAVPEVFFHEYGAVQGYEVDNLGDDELNKAIANVAAKWLEDKNDIDTWTAACPFTVTGNGAYGLGNKLLDCLNYVNSGQDGCEEGGVMAYLGSGIIHDAAEVLGDLVQNEAGNWWVTGGLTAGVHALKLHSVVAAVFTVYSQTRTNGDGQAAIDWFWVIGNGRHRGYSCAKAAQTLCKGHQVSMQRAYVALADEQSGLPAVDHEACLEIYDDIVRLGSILEKADYEEEAGEAICVELVGKIAKSIDQARGDGVPPALLLDAVRLGLDYGFRRVGFWAMVLGSLYYRDSHADLSVDATREFV